MIVLLLIRASMLNLSFMFFTQAKAAIIDFKEVKNFRRLRQAFKFSMKPGCLCTAATQKTISYACCV